MNQFNFAIARLVVFQWSLLLMVGRKIEKRVSSADDKKTAAARYWVRFCEKNLLTGDREYRGRSWFGK